MVTMRVNYCRWLSDNLPYEKVGKNEPVCIADEVPFDIPESWEWVRLGTISTYAETKKKINAQDADPNLWGLDLEDIEKGGQLISQKTVGERKAVGDKTIFKCGDILYSKLRPYLLKILVAPNNGICTPEIVPFNLYGKINAYYIVEFLKSPYVDQVINSVTYGVKMPRVGTETMTSLLVPLPPISEQARIVARLKCVLSAVQSYNTAYDKGEKLTTKFPIQLKKSILQYAVQGKLVPQDPADEPASVLLERIRTEKEQLIKEGKIKRDKHESVIFRRDNSYYEQVDGIERCIDDEIPFEIPASWAWTRLFSLCSNITDGEHKTPRRTAEYVGYYLLSARNIRDGHLSLEDVDYVDGKEYSLISKRCNPKRNNILISCSGSIGRVCLVPDDGNYVMVRSAAVAVPILVHSKYLMYALQSEIVQKQIKSKIKQAVQANLFQGEIRNLIIPVPPFDEQQRIVRKLDYLLIKTKL